jgi:exodeoxyribonuclease V alpha subunit
MSEIGKSVTVSITVSTSYPGPLGGAVFAGRDEKGDFIRAVARREHIFRAPLKGEVWRITGLRTIHKRYGEQVSVVESALLRPTGHMLIRYLAMHPAFRGTGVGPAKAARLYNQFGERLVEILDSGSVESMKDCIGETSARKLIEAWQEHAREAAVVTFLDHNGVDARLAEKILRHWPEEAVKKLQENPYRILAFTAWPTADRLAMSLGVAADDSRRLIAAAEAAVYKRLDAYKETLVNGDELNKGISALLRCSDERVICESVRLAVDDKSLVCIPGGGYQAAGCAVMEQFLTARFKEMVSTGTNGSEGENSSGEKNLKIGDCIRRLEGRGGITLSAEQRAAVFMAADTPLSVLTGGAGVGKTTALKTVRHTVEFLGGSVILMALAGRAAQRLREATGGDVYTIAAFLNRVQSGNLQLTPRHLLVVDEASMLDLMLMYRIVRALPQGARLLLVGDPYQLPPIGPGLVFHVLSASRAIPIQALTQVHRQSEATGIPLVAEKIRKGIIPELPQYNGPSVGVSFYDCAPTAIVNRLIDIASELGAPGDLQILGITKNGVAGVNVINEVFHRKLTPAKRKIEDWGFAESDPVIYTVNDYDKELYNGSLGRIVKVIETPLDSGNEEEPDRVVVDFDGRELGLSVSGLCNLELAYAITTHKAQGSQFKRVVIPITLSRLLDRTLIYTALTRGVEQVVFVGDRQAFDVAVSNMPAASLRNVGLKL